MSLSPSANDIPRPDFVSISAGNGPPTPKLQTPERFTILKRNSPVSTPPDSPTRQSLSSPDKKALKALLSLTRSIDNSVERLYSFCEHNFNEQLASLMVDYFDKHLNSFKELNNLIISQSIVSESLASESTPSPVKFSLNSNLGSVEEDWPEPESDQWIDAAKYYIKGPKDVSSSLRRDSVPLQERLLNADQKRKQLENIKRLEIRKQTNRVRRVVEKRKKQSKDAETAIKEKLDAAEQRREEFLNQKKVKARNEIEKSQESKYIVELEAEGKRAELTRKSDEIIKRHEQMVRDSQEKARERTLAKSPTCASRTRKKMGVKKGSLSLTEALSLGQLPGELLIDDESEGSYNFPSIAEPKETLSPASLEIVGRIENNPNDAKNTLHFLKLLFDFQLVINSNSRAGNALAKSIKEIIRNNASCADNIIKLCSMISDHSLAFGLRVATESLSVFPSLCKHKNSISCIKELILLCTKLANAKNAPLIREYIIDQLSSSVAMDSVCFLLSACSIDDLADNKLSQLINSVISLIQAMADLYFEGKGDKAAGIECTVRAIGPSIIVFLSAMSVDTQKAPHELVSATTIALSHFVIAFPSSVDSMVDDQISASINGVMRAFIQNAKQSQASKHLIVLFGLLCKGSSTVRDSCIWPPQPTLLKLLCEMPLEFFIKKDGSAILLPTIAAFCFGNNENTKYVKKVLNVSLVSKFLVRTPPNPKSIISISYRITQEDANILIAELNKEDNIEEEKKSK